MYIILYGFVTVLIFTNNSVQFFASCKALSHHQRIIHYPSMVNHLRIILERLRSCVASAFSQFTYETPSVVSPGIPQTPMLCCAKTSLEPRFGVLTHSCRKLNQFCKYRINNNIHTHINIKKPISIYTISTTTISIPITKPNEVLCRMQ
jgi:hypothetical protein